MSLVIRSQQYSYFLIGHCPPGVLGQLGRKEKTDLVPSVEEIKCKTSQKLMIYLLWDSKI